MLESGQTLSARFTLVRRLGAGGHGEVWLAEDRERQGYVALKIFAAALIQDPQILTAIERTCARVQQLAHPHILKLFGVFRDLPHAWLASEYAAGGDLSALRGRSAQELLPRLTPIAEALEYAHSHQVVHGDLKPTNLLVGSDDSVLLSDFAIDLDATGVAAGSPYNLSPQRLAGAALTPGDDAYGFGALTYELLSGYPPFYPQPTRERVLSEPVATVVPRYPAPAELVNLVMRCLQKDANARPDMQEIAQTLRALSDELRRKPDEPATADAPRLVAPSDAALRPRWQRTVSASEQSRGSRAGWLRGVAVSLVAILGLAAIGAFVVLPRWAQERQEATAPPASEAANATSALKTEQPVDYALLAEQKRQAEEMRGPVDERWQRLQQQAVQRWASDDTAQVVQVIQQADAAYAEREYARTQRLLQKAAQTLAALETRVPEVLATQLRVGREAIDAGDSRKALAAYGLALAMDRDNADAQRGHKRAQTLDQVLSLMATARSQEQAAQRSPALESYRAALKLDPQMQAASVAIARIEGQLANDAFGRAMARGFKEMSAERYAQARAALDEAAAIRPGAAEVERARDQLQQSERTRAIAQHLQRSSEHEAQERWAEALAELRAALQLDHTVAAALEGVRRVEPRARLHEEFELYLTQPERLFAAAVRQRARTAMQYAQGLPRRGPVLQRQLSRLEDWLKRAETPVRVSLQSDNLTHVTIHRVGELGAFSERSLELAPGKYTAVGTRPGYRDVRREFALQPGENPATVVIRCEDPV